ncbi:MAG: TIGR04282 family arsenosugar biosynthesis glycosyltransferase [Alcanivorax sp.]|nr:TIGR04282 family arsenosugar biosynthesis glycosyltransferase [Alcanivorax sp.]
MTADTRLIVFARALRAGQVKTRLIPTYGAEGALAIYRQLLDAALMLASEFPGPVELLLDQHDEALCQRALAAGWRYGLQRGDGLGERMANALADALEEQECALLIGSDCPVLGQAYLQQALHALQDRSPVFGASEDGGYVLLASHRRTHWSPRCFDGVRFGGPDALADSLACWPSSVAGQLPALWDVDEAEDVRRAVAEGILVTI